MVAERVVDLLEPVEVHECHSELGARRPLFERSGQATVELAAVAESGQRVVRRFPLELVDQFVILERHRRVVGQCLEQLEVVGVECRDVAFAVGDGHRSDHLAVASQRNEHPVDPILRLDPARCVPVTGPAAREKAAVAWFGRDPRRGDSRHRSERTRPAGGGNGPIGLGRLL